jgi:hypothetical protein
MVKVTRYELDEDGEGHHFYKEGNVASWYWTTVAGDDQSVNPVFEFEVSNPVNEEQQ